MSELIKWQDKDLTEYYEAESVDAVLAEKDKEIVELKAEVLKLKSKNIELKSFYDLHGNVDNYIDKLKSESDAVVASKDCEIKKLKDTISQLLKARTEEIIHEVVQNTLIYGEGFIRVEDAMKLVAELRHNKYKRCLEMARVCKDEAEINHNSAYEASEYMPSYEDKFRRKAEHYERWETRWKELAYKFKEAY